MDYKSLPMLATGNREAVIPADAIMQTWNLMYFIEVMDGRSRGRIYPDLNRETPCIIVKVKR